MNNYAGQLGETFQFCRYLLAERTWFHAEVVRWQIGQDGFGAQAFETAEGHGISLRPWINVAVLTSCSPQAQVPPSYLTAARSIANEKNISSSKFYKRELQQGLLMVSLR
jgi:hypothetical protein